MKRLVLLALLAAAAPHYHVVRHLHVGGEGGWDYPSIDAATRRLFVAHSDRVEVIDLATGKVAGTIGDTQGVHGIAFDAKLHRGFITAGRTSTVVVFDTKSLQRTGEVKTTGERPDAVLFEPVTSRVFTFNAAGHNTTAIDAARLTVTGTLDLGGKPEFPVADGHGHVFVNIEDKSEIVEFDANSLHAIRRWKLEGCEEPTGLAFDAAQHRLFSGCDNKVIAVSDARAGKSIGTIPAGGGIDGVAFDPKRDLVFSANGADGTMTVADAKTLHVIENVPTRRSARTIVLDEATHRLYLPAADVEAPRKVMSGTFEVLEVGE